MAKTKSKSPGIAIFKSAIISAGIAITSLVGAYSLNTEAQFTTVSDPFNVLGTTGGAKCTIDRPCVIYLEEQTFDPEPANRKVFADEDLYYKINGTNSDDYVEELQEGAVCEIKIKVFDATDDDTDQGFEPSIGKLEAVNDDNSPFTGSAQNIDTNNNGKVDTLRMPYDTANGCKVKLPANEQSTYLWQIEGKVINPDDTAFLGTPAYFFKYGAVGVTEITGQKVP